MLKILSIFGTRPEAIKLAPVIKELERQPDSFASKVCVTGQHQEMLKQVLEVFAIKPDYDLRIMQPNQDLFDITSRVLIGLRKILTDEKPDWILVQGDSTTTVSASLAAFYSRLRIGHIEAGLRSHNKFLPFPEEVNRRITDMLSDIHFVPTDVSKENLLKEGIPSRSIIITGNTVIDALLWIMKKVKDRPVHIAELTDFDWEKQMILVTGHRRESFGDGLKSICDALSRIARRYPDVNMIYPVHLNPTVYHTVTHTLRNMPNIYLIPPQNYDSFVWLMTKAYFILTDSGGIQEEASALGKPVLVMRSVTDRPEGIEAGTTRLVGTDIASIVEHVEILLKDRDAYNKMARVKNLYGDGMAAKRIVEGLKNFV
jgi:UDP-N-acetylglucosamine 2-epimerase (non-hydrolysing)